MSILESRRSSASCSTGFQPVPSDVTRREVPRLRLRATGATWRAFTLTEMLFALALIGVAAVLSARLFTGSMRVIGNAPSAQNHFAAIDRISASIRRDVWSSVTIETPDPQTLLLTQSDHSKVRWTFSTGGVERTESDSDQRWPIDVSLSVARQGAQAILKSETNDELRFTSELIASKGGRP